jgi:hypothetical protein
MLFYDTPVFDYSGTGYTNDIGKVGFYKTEIELKIIGFLQ